MLCELCPENDTRHFGSQNMSLLGGRVWVSLCPHHIRDYQARVDATGESAEYSRARVAFDTLYLTAAHTATPADDAAEIIETFHEARDAFAATCREVIADMIADAKETNDAPADSPE